MTQLATLGEDNTSARRWKNNAKGYYRKTNKKEGERTDIFFVQTFNEGTKVNPL
jgi:hypothetical protein